MSIIGNIFLGIASLILFSLVTSNSKPMPGGDAGVGYAWFIIMLNLGFVLCMGIVALVIGFKGGFEWVSVHKSTRILYVTVSVIAVLIFVGLCRFLQAEAGHYSALLKMLIKAGSLFVPFLMIFISVILLNDSLKASFPLAVYKWLSIFIVALSIVTLTTLLLGQFAGVAKRQAVLLGIRKSPRSANDDRILAQIDSCDVTTSLGSILVFSGDNQPAYIQNAAVAKIKTNPNWEKTLIEYFETDWAPDVFQFLASNDVDSPSLFEEPVQKGIYIQARLVRERIRRCSHPSHFYPGMFDWDIQRVIRTVDKFQSKEIDYLPAIKELRAALDEPSELDKPKFNSAKMLDKWIKGHS